MSAPRLHAEVPLAAGATVELPPAAARHVQVLRLQPGAALRLFDGRGGEAAATVLEIGRREVRVRVDAVEAVERELPLAVTLAVGVPANDRMDALVEKAVELGAAAIVPLVCERSVLRLEGERAARRIAHWQAVAVAACEQCGRNRVPAVAPFAALPAWLRGLPPAGADAAGARWLLSPRAGTALPRAWSTRGAAPASVAAAERPGRRPRAGRGSAGARRRVRRRRPRCARAARRHRAAGGAGVAGGAGGRCAGRRPCGELTGTACLPPAASAKAGPAARRPTPACSAASSTTRRQACPRTVFPRARLGPAFAEAWTCPDCGVAKADFEQVDL